MSVFSFDFIIVKADTSLGYELYHKFYNRKDVERYVLNPMLLGTEIVFAEYDIDYDELERVRYLPVEELIGVKLYV